MIGLRGKILLGVGALLMILVVISALASAVLGRYGRSTERLLEEDLASVIACESIMGSIDQMIVHLRRAQTGEIEAAQQGVPKHVKDIEAQLAVQAGLITATGEQELTEQFRQEWRQFRQDYPGLFAPGLTIPQRQAYYTSTVFPGTQRLKETARDLSHVNIAAVQATHQKVQSIAHTAKFTMHLLLVSGLAVALMVVWFIGRTVLRPLQALTESVQQIERDRLDLAVPVHSTDELGRLSIAFNDMTQHLRSRRRDDEERLLRTRQTTQLAIDSLPDAVMVVSPDGRVELVNQIARRLFSVEPGMPVGSLPHRGLSELHSLALSEERMPEFAGFDSAIRTDDAGQERFFLPKAVPIATDEGRVVGSTLILADVTDLRRLDQMKSGLLSMVSHELKTPLTSMRMILHLLVEQKIGPLTLDQLELITAARDDSDRLHQIVENLLDMGRIEAGRALMDVHPVPAGELVEQSVRALRPAFDDHGIDLLYDPPDPDPLVMADATRIGHVLTNLLGNAVKYTPRGGSVRVSIARLGPEWVEIAVADTGAGIPRQYQHRVFEKFFRVPGQAGESGAGLGLAIARDVVSAHGGQIGVESIEGSGSTFRFILRRAEAGTDEVVHGTEAATVG